MPLDNFLRLLDDFLGSRLVSRGGSIGRGSMTVSLLGLRGVDGSSLVGDISNETVDMVSGVGGGLDSAVGKSNHEATGNDTVGILCFCLLEVGLAVVISNSIFISIRLRGELLLNIWSRGTISWGSSGESCGHEGRGNEDLKWITLDSSLKKYSFLS